MKKNVRNCLTGMTLKFLVNMKNEMKSEKEKSETQQMIEGKRQLCTTLELRFCQSSIPHGCSI